MALAIRCWLRPASPMHYFGRPKTPLHGLPCPPQRLMIADLAPSDHGPHRLAVTVYHHEVEGRREGVVFEGSIRGSGSCPSLNRIANRLTAQRMQGCSFRYRCSGSTPFEKHSSIFGSLLVLGSVEIGPDLFRHACLLGLEGMEHRDSVYRGGRFDRWVKVKNRQHHAYRISSDEDHRAPISHVDGGLLADIFIVRSAMRWLRLYG